jgi:carbon storage regulator
MLVLTRRAGEKLVIGNEVVVEVLSISGDSIRLGIKAPKETSVHRFEVFEEIQAANRAATAATMLPKATSVKEIAAQLRSLGEEAHKEEAT